MVKSEFYKLKKSRPFWICLCVCIFVAALLPFALSQAVASGEPDVQDLSLSAVEITSYAFSMPILTWWQQSLPRFLCRENLPTER